MGMVTGTQREGWVRVLSPGRRDLAGRRLFSTTLPPSCDCELEGMLPPYLSACLDHVQNLWLEFEPSRKSSRRAATDLLTALTGRTPGLRGLCLE